MLGSGYLNVHDSKMIAQVHLYRLFQYKGMMRQATYNFLYKDTPLYHPCSWSELVSRNSSI